MYGYYIYILKLELFLLCLGHLLPHFFFLYTTHIKATTNITRELGYSNRIFTDEKIVTITSKGLYLVLCALQEHWVFSIVKESNAVD